MDVEVRTHGLGSCGWEPDKTFMCRRCDQIKCYCEGAHDDMPALCDDCWMSLMDSSPQAADDEWYDDNAEKTVK